MALFLLQQGGLILKHPNIRTIVTELSKDYSYAEIGKIFSESLLKRQLDKIAFCYPENPMKLKRMQSKIISEVKPRLFKPILLKELDSSYDFYNIDFSQVDIKNKDSLLGSICELLYEANEEQGFEEIGFAVLRGAEQYMKEFPMAQYMSINQFREYRLIKKEIQNKL